MYLPGDGVRTVVVVDSLSNKEKNHNNHASPI